MRFATIADIANLPLLKSNLTYKDLKKECVARGMPFLEVISGDFPRLTQWLLNNSFKPVEPNRLDEFDNWQEEILRKEGKEYLIHNSLRLGYLGEKDDSEPTEKKVKEVKDKKPPREKMENGLFKGTKKSYTYELQAKGKSLEEVIVKVTRKFPGAIEKSIKIWYNKAKKLNVQKDRKGNNS